LRIPSYFPLLFIRETAELRYKGKEKSRIYKARAMAVE